MSMRRKARGVMLVTELSFGTFVKSILCDVMKDILLGVHPVTTSCNISEYADGVT